MESIIITTVKLKDYKMDSHQGNQTVIAQLHVTLDGSELYSPCQVFMLEFYASMFPLSARVGDTFSLVSIETRRPGFTSMSHQLIPLPS